MTQDSPLDSNAPATDEDVERLCAELKGQISRAQRLVDEAKTFLEEAGAPEPPAEP